MSTRIGISVDLGGLLKRNRQQAIANRQATVEGSQQKQLAVAAEVERERRLASEKKQQENSRRQDFKREEPAANLFTTNKIFFGPKFDPLIVFRYETEFQKLNDYYFAFDSLKNKNSGTTTPALQPGRYYIKGYELINTSNGRINRTSRVPGAGPGGGDALRILGTSTVGVSVTSFRQLGAGIPRDDDVIESRTVTVECFIRVDIGQTIDPTVINLAFNGCRVELSNRGQSFFIVNSTFAPSEYVYSLSYDLSNLVMWRHFAIVFSGKIYRLFIDGALIGAFSAYTNTASLGIRALGLVTTVDNFDTFFATATDSLWISSLRIVNRARYGSAGFTPPTTIT